MDYPANLYEQHPNLKPSNDLRLIPPETSSTLPAMADEDIGRVRALEQAIAGQPQIDIPIVQTLHAGMYARTAIVPAGAMITGALIKIPTILIVNGDCDVYVGDRTVRLVGHHVLEAEAGRKQAFIAYAETHLTMLFPTQAASVEEAEAEFTDEVAMLQTRKAQENPLCPA